MERDKLLKTAVVLLLCANACWLVVGLLYPFISALTTGYVAYTGYLVLFLVLTLMFSLLGAWFGVRGLRKRGDGDG